MATLDEKLAELETEVAETETGIDSAIAFIAGLVVLIADLRTQVANAGASPAVLALIDTFKSRLDAKQQSLAAAQVAEPPPTP